VLGPAGKAQFSVIHFASPLGVEIKPVVLVMLEYSQRTDSHSTGFTAQCIALLIWLGVKGGLDVGFSSCGHPPTIPCPSFIIKAKVQDSM